MPALIEKLQDRFVPDTKGDARGWLRAHAPEALFCATCFLWLCYYVFMTSYFDQLFANHSRVLGEDFVMHRLMLLPAAAELIRLWRGEYGHRDVIALLIAAAMGLGAFRAGATSVMMAVLLVYCARRLDARRVVRGCAILLAVLVAFIVACSLVGIIPNAVLYAERHAPRYCLGFRYHLYLPQYLLALTCVWVWLRGMKADLCELVGLAALNVVVLLLTGARAAPLTALGLLAVVLLYQRTSAREDIWNKVFSVLRFALLAAAAISALVALAYAHNDSSEQMVRFNELLHGRLEVGLQSMKDYGVSLFGSKEYVASGGLEVGLKNMAVAVNYDMIYNAFVHAAVRFGLVYTAGLLALWTACSHVAYRKGETMLVLALAAFAVPCLFSNLSLMLTYNPFGFLIAGLSLGELVLPSKEELAGKIASLRKS